MADFIWITTTTTPDGKFDIFQFTGWLQSATLIDLYIGLAHMETLAIAYEERWSLLFGEAQDEAAAKAGFYNNLHHLISIEICDRTDGSFKPQYPN